MDIMISIVNLSPKDFQKYVTAIDESNLDKFIKGELKDLLDTARTQTKQAQKMGWL
jgi:hypothetical protein